MIITGFYIHPLFSQLRENVRSNACAHTPRTGIYHVHSTALFTLNSLTILDTRIHTHIWVSAQRSHDVQITSFCQHNVISTACAWWEPSGHTTLRWRRVDVNATSFRRLCPLGGCNGTPPCCSSFFKGIHVYVLRPFEKKGLTLISFFKTWSLLRREVKLKMWELFPWKSIHSRETGNIYWTVNIGTLACMQCAHMTTFKPVN